MRAIICILVFIITVSSAAFGASLSDCTGVIRVFGDGSSWMSSCFVVGDGSWIITSSDTITEKSGPNAEQTIKYPLFISAYTGQAYQCELKARDKDLNIALLKLPVSGLPAAPLAQIGEFSKAAYGTMGQLTSGEPMGNSWPTEVYGITRKKTDTGYKLTVNSWDAKKVFVTDIGNFKWAFISDVNPNEAIPNGSMVVRGSNVVGLYINRLTITGGKEDVIFGRCAMSTEIARYLGDHGVSTSTLYEPPKQTIKREAGADAAFQLQARIYSLIGAKSPELAVEPATELSKLQPKDAQAKMVLGLALNAAGKFDEALISLDEASALDPKLPTLRMNRALAYVGLKKTKEAEGELLKAIEEAPEDIRPVTALADFYMGDDKTLDKAFTYAQKAITMASSNPTAQLLIARVEKRRQNYQAAINAISEALKIAPSWGDAMYALGSTYEEAGDKANAEKAYRTLIAKQPKDPRALLTLASFLVDQGKKDEATGLISKLKELSPSKDILDLANALQEKIEGKQDDSPKAADK